MVTVRQVRLKMLRVAFALVIVATTALAAQAATASWDPNTEPNIAGYKLSYGTQPGVHTITLDVGNVTTCQFNPGPGVYYVVVQAYDADGELSENSAEVMINIPGTVTIPGTVPATSTNAAAPVGPGPTMSVNSADSRGSVNRLPTLAQPQNQSSARTTNVSLALAANDPEGARLTFSSSALPPGLSLNTASGLIAGVVSQAGSYQVTVSVTDGALSVSRSFTWTVNQVPSTAPAANSGAPAGASVPSTVPAANGGAPAFPSTVPAANSGAPVVSTPAPSTKASVTTLDDGATVTFKIPFSDGDASAGASLTETSTPPSIGPSADGTVVPPASQIVDPSGAVWTIGGPNAILRNGVWASSGTGSKILLSGGVIYVLGGYNNWWKWLGSSWSFIGSAPPGMPATPPSANGTLVPPASHVTDATGSVWTIDSAQRILRDGVQASGGTGSKILWASGSVYALGSNGRTWWMWSGSWTNVGTIPPLNSGASAAASVTSAVPASNSGAPKTSAEALKTNVSAPAAVLPPSSEQTVNAAASQPSLEDSDLPVLGDFDGDGRSDLATYDSSSGEWRIWTAQSGFSAPIMAVWGMAGDLPVPADYDGDRATDIAFYRPSTGSWHVWLSRSQKHLVVQWGDPEDRPVSLDHDGDGKADLALVRDGGYEILLSRTNYLTSVTVR